MLRTKLKSVCIKGDFTGAQRLGIRGLDSTGRYVEYKLCLTPSWRVGRACPLGEGVNVIFLRTLRREKGGGRPQPSFHRVLLACGLSDEGLELLNKPLQRLGWAVTCCLTWKTRQQSSERRSHAKPQLCQFYPTEILDR